MTEIRSFRTVFDLERRIYRVDSVRLNPAGIPVRGVVYFATAVVAVRLASALPLSRNLLELLPWYFRYLGLPAVIALVLGLIRVEGRPFHSAALALVRFVLTRQADRGSRRRSNRSTWRPSELVFLPDGSDATLRGLCYTGPGLVVVRVPHRREARASGERSRLRSSWSRGGLVVTEGPAARARPVAISAGPGARVRIRAAGETAAP